MTAKGKSIKKKLSEEEIDRTVVGQADNDSAWEEPIHVRKTKPTSFSVSGELVSRAAFLARLHRERCVEEWIMRIIRERIELEEFAFVEAKREIAVKGSL